MEVNGLNTCNAKHLGLRVTRILNIGAEVEQPGLGFRKRDPETIGAKHTEIEML